MPHRPGRPGKACLAKGNRHSCTAPQSSVRECWPSKLESIVRMLWGEGGAREGGDAGGAPRPARPLRCMRCLCKSFAAFSAVRWRKTKAIWACLLSCVAEASSWMARASAGRRQPGST